MRARSSSFSQACDLPWILLSNPTTPAPPSHKLLQTKLDRAGIYMPLAVLFPWVSCCLLGCSACMLNLDAHFKLVRCTRSHRVDAFPTSPSKAALPFHMPTPQAVPLIRRVACALPDPAQRRVMHARRTVLAACDALLQDWERVHQEQGQGQQQEEVKGTGGHHSDACTDKSEIWLLPPHLIMLGV